MRRDQQHGFTLIELMIAMLISIIVLLFFSDFFIRQVEDERRMSRRLESSQQLDDITTFIQRELQRAGYAENGSADFRSNTISADKSCISYRYDKNKNNALDVGEARVIKYDAATKSIKVKLSQAISNSSCSGSSGWIALSDETIDVENFALCAYADAAPTAIPPAACPDFIAGTQQASLFLGIKDKKTGKTLQKTVQLTLYNIPF